MRASDERHSIQGGLLLLPRMLDPVTALSALHGIQSGRLRRWVRAGSAARSTTGAGVGIVIATAAIALLAIVKPF